LIVGLVTAASATAGGIVFVRTTLSPINKLKDAVRRVADGDLRCKVEVNRNDDIGSLARDFNSLSYKLQASFGSLEQRIAERTQELVKTNELLQVEICERKQNEQHKMIQYAIARILTESVTLDEASPKIIKAICEMQGWDLGGIWIVDQQANVIRCKEIWHVQSFTVTEFLAMSKKITFSPCVGLPGRVWAGAKHIWIADVVADANFPRAHIAQKEGLHGAFGFPILSKEECLGVIEFFSRELRQPDDDLISMIDAIGSHIGQFILRGQTERLLKRTVAERDASISEMKYLIDFSVLMREEMQEGEVIRHMSQVRKEPSCECLLEKMEDGGYMCIPLITGETIAGVVMMVKKEKGCWERKELHEFLNAYVGIAASALHRVRLLSITRNAAVTDALTGIYNRRFFDEMLLKQITLAERRNESLCLLVIDPDYFKKINDTYGHKAGDCILRELTGIIKNSLRSSDVLARYGGEEFVVIMPATNITGALEKAESMRKQVEFASFDDIVHECPLKVTISIGVASFPVHGADYNALIGAADSAMYKAKENGRNRVEAP
jgi:diguanylate cyclase (GGDEF)-like protein